MFTKTNLTKNPSFKMTKEDFNSLVNSISPEEQDGSKPVKVAVSVRTMASNKVFKKDNSVLLEGETKPHNTKGYFSLIISIQKLIMDEFNIQDFNVIKNTILMPVGAFENEQGELVVYFHLILQETVEDVFHNLVPISNETLNNLDFGSTMVLQTLSIVNYK